MSVYTTELRHIVESGFDLKLTDYPIFDEDYRPDLNRKIIDHFYFREIGFETAGLFANRLRVRLNEIMPYYNQLYKSALLEFDPLNNEHSEETEKRSYSDDSEDWGTNTRKSDGESENHSMSGGETSDARTDTGKMVENSSDTGATETIGSDTPQGFLSTTDLDAGTWATNASRGKTSSIHDGSSSTDAVSTGKSQSQSATDQTARFTNNDSDTEHKTGKRGGWANVERSIMARRGVSGASLLLEFRETFLNIDMLIIGELESLFMGVWK